MPKEYRPVNCGFYDQLLLYSDRKVNCKISYKNEMNQIIHTTSKILDVYTQNKTEYLLLEGDVRVRLDFLIGVEEE